MLGPGRPYRNHQPLKHRRYPKRMTLAIGALTQDGVMLCADTLVSGSTHGEYESKLVGYRFRDGLAVFGLAGYFSSAHSAIQECEPILRKSGPKRTHREIASQLKPTLARMMKIQVIDPKLDWTTYGYEIVAAIWSSVDGLGLYAGDYTSFSEIRGSYQCIGSGHDIATFLIKPHLAPIIRSERYVTSITAHALSRVRAFSPAMVGGDPIMLTIRKDGTPFIWARADFVFLTKAAGVVSGFQEQQLMEFLLSDDLETVRTGLDNFASMVEHEKEEWLANAHKLIWSAVPREAFSLLTDLRIKQPGPRRRIFPKGDQKPPQPSQA